MTAPKWARALLCRVAPKTRADDVLGDLEEAHRRRVGQRGHIVAWFATGLEALDVAFALLRNRVRRQRDLSGPPSNNARRRDGTNWISRLDVMLGLRMLVKYPGLTIIGGLGMAVAIAIGTGSFAFFTSYAFPNLPLDEGARIVALENWDVEANNEYRQSMHDYAAWRKEMETVDDMAAFRDVARNLIVDGSPAVPARIGEMTASGFRVARVPPLLGRPVLDEDERAGAPRVLVIGYDVWQSRFLGDPNVIGRQVGLGSTPHTIVGVMPDGFAFPMNHSYWRPLDTDSSAFDRGAGPEIFIFGRLAPGVSFEHAQAELGAIGQRSATAYPETHARLRPQVLPYTYPLIDIQDVAMWDLWLMIGTISLALVVVAVNVAVLAYARTAMRRSEIAVRTALGASRGRIVMQLFVEAFVLSASAAAAGVALSQIGLRLAHQIMAAETDGTPFWMEYGVSPTTLVYAVGLTVLAAVIIGVIPGFQATGGGMHSGLQRAGGDGGARLGKTWTVLIVAQVAIATAALPTAIGSGWREIKFATTEPTFPVNEFLAARLAMDREPPPGADEAEYERAFEVRYSGFQSELSRRLEGEPGVTAVTFASRIPGSERVATIEVEGGSVPAASASGHQVRSSRVAVDFFEAFGVPILSGRPFHAGEVAAEQAAVLVNRPFAQQILAGDNALGHRFRYVNNRPAGEVDEAQPVRWYEIVGVVGDFYANRFEPELAPAMVYHPLSPSESNGAFLAVRAEGGMTLTLGERFREITTSLDPSLRLGMIPLADLRHQQELALQLVALVLGLVIVSVLLLTAAGIYALMSFTVTQRRREIGIRTALGAHPRRILSSVFSRALGQLGVGVGLGVVVAVLIGQGVAALPVVAVLIVVVGLMAAVGPARRGLRVEPTEALREG